MNLGRVTHFLNLGVKLSRSYPHDDRFHFCAILADRSRVVSVGFNTKRVHPRSTTPFKTLHAEQDCIISSITEGCVLYIARTGWHGRRRVLFSRPCEGCRSAIFRAGIREVYYTCDESLIHCWKVRSDTTMRIPLTLSI